MSSSNTSLLTNHPRVLGAFYTECVIALEMTRRVIRNSSDVVLEPCFGGGAFLRSAAKRLRELGGGRSQIVGVELDEGAFRACIEDGLLDESKAIHDNFLAVEPFRVSVVVGNPPYVRLRHLGVDYRDLALRRAAECLGEPMATRGSVWMPFVLHASRFLDAGGRMALVLPYELTYVQYARPLWQFLAGRFGKLEVIRIYERLFTDLNQEVVLFFAEDFGGQTDEVRYKTYESLRDWIANLHSHSDAIRVDDIVAGRKPFEWSLLGPELRQVILRAQAKMVSIDDLCAFDIGYVTGDKSFFHPSEEDVAKYGIPREHLRPAVSTGRQLRGIGVRTSSMPRDRRTYLYDPPTDPAAFSEGDREYIREGEKRGVHRRYKCRTRDPWYKVPYLGVPDVILAVFAETPILIENDEGLLASNSLLCGYIRHSSISPRSVVASWYNSLTLLFCELEIHSLGGGVMVLIPGEVNRIWVPVLADSDVSNSFIEDLDQLLRRAGGADEAYQLGDELVLQTKMGLQQNEIEMIRGGIDALRRWRRGRPKADFSDEDLAGELTFVN